MHCWLNEPSLAGVFLIIKKYITLVKKFSQVFKKKTAMQIPKCTCGDQGHSHNHTSHRTNLHIYISDVPVTLKRSSSNYIIP